MLTVEGLQAAYGDSRVLFGIDLSVARGEVVTLLGRNGMGKTTTVRSIFGLLRPRGGRVSINGRDLTAAAPHLVARAGLGLVPEGRQGSALDDMLALSIVQNYDGSGIPLTGMLNLSASLMAPWEFFQDISHCEYTIT